MVETSADPDAFLADEPPEWADRLPGPMEPGEFYLKGNQEFIDSQFQQPDQRGEVIIEGDVSDPAVLDALATAETAAGEQSVTADRATGEPAVESVLSAMERRQLPIGSSGSVWRWASGTRSWRASSSCRVCSLSGRNTGVAERDTNTTVAQLDHSRSAESDSSR